MFLKRAKLALLTHKVSLKKKNVLSILQGYSGIFTPSVISEETARTLLIYNFKVKICEAINKTITKRMYLKNFFFKYIARKSMFNEMCFWSTRLNLCLTILQTHANHFITLQRQNAQFLVYREVVGHLSATSLKITFPLFQHLSIGNQWDSSCTMGTS